MIVLQAYVVLNRFDFFVFLIFLIFFIQETLSVPEKLKNSKFKIPITLQNLNINNDGTTSAKSINLDIIRKLIKYSLKILW